MRPKKRKRNDRTPAQARKERAQTMREIARDLKKADRARLLELKASVRALAGERSRAIARARAACKGRRRGVPTLKEAAAILRAARAEARSTCDRELEGAKKIRDAGARARAQRDAERKHQKEMRRLEAQARARKKEARPGLASARERRAESDDEVRANIPPELVPLFDRVKRQIRASDRVTRTEAFLHYAHEHPDEDLQALEHKADAMIEEYQRRAGAGATTVNIHPGRLRNPPRVTCPPSWWRLPFHERARVIRKLATSSNARARRAAVALILAEQDRRRRARSPRRKRNPRELVSLVYREKKPGDREAFDYEHEFEGELPMLEMRGGAVQIKGGTYTTRRGWIEG
jgi:hypothetical protein